MKVYVDELPKICKDCACLNRVNGRCQLLHLYVDEDEKQEDCPLESIADHDKKVRAEVCDRFRKIALKYYTIDEKGNLTLTCNDMWDILGVLGNSENSQKSSTGGEE